MIRKAVITAAGLGTRLIPATKEMPKEMLPIFVRSDSGPVLKPLLQVLFEKLYEFGIKEFCFVVGRGKRAIEDHFTPDWEFVEKLESKGKTNQAGELEGFYRMLEKSVIVWVNQPSPLGFGDAVLRSRPFADEDFLLCAGDTYVHSPNNDFLKSLKALRAESICEVSLLLRRIENPSRFGVAVVEDDTVDRLRVVRVVEKPSVPPSDLAILPFYVFTPQIFDALDSIGLGYGGEFQLTDAIQLLIDRGKVVMAVELPDSDIWLDVGTPESYFEALKISYALSGGA
ncbi:MAG: sugar phosphate nucleotidyltransferase [Thaumarchaeota archaeon]|nr:sugar phosphate nucleotidyltransferase [Candidatus Calditenuaceae archaeon]MDW8186961.1 sugar phosphate nucleotidyltransferase [Nitrososphaerota archaeon]